MRRWQQRVRQLERQSSSSSSSSSSGGTGSATTCIANASETAGPYPSDGSNTVNGMVSNVLQQAAWSAAISVRVSAVPSGIAGGVPMTLKLSVVNSNNNCALLSGYAVYLWHCTREGAYSLYSSGVQDENYLRGVQVTDANGEVTFTSIFPGCYSGRYPHIHFEVYPSLAMATLYTNRILTSQMALPRDVCNTVYAGASGYSPERFESFRRHDRQRRRLRRQHHGADRADDTGVHRQRRRGLQRHRAGRRARLTEEMRPEVRGRI